MKAFFSKTFFHQRVGMQHWQQCPDFWTKISKVCSKGEQIYKTKKYKKLHPQILFLDTKNAISTNIPKVYGKKTDKCSVKVRQKIGELVLYQKQMFTPKNLSRQ